MDPTLRLEQAADRALDQGRWGPALMMLKQAANQAARPSREAHLLSRALELAWTRLAKDHEDVRLLSERLLDLDPDDGHALARLAVSLLLADDPRGHSLLGQALEGPGAHDPDLWGSLAWALKRQVEGGATEHAGRMLELYWRGVVASPDLPDAYPLLNFLEERAIAEGLAPQHILREDPRDPAFDLRAALEVALRILEQQFAAGHEAPWPAFDLARGRYYLRRMGDPEGARPRHLLLADLSTAARETLRVARRASDRHPLSRTARTCRRLRQAGIFAPDMRIAEALLLNHHANDALWLSFDDEALATPQERRSQRSRQARSEYLRVLQALHDQRDQLTQLGSRSADLETALASGLEAIQGQQAQIDAHLRSLRQTLSQVDERTWGQLELPEQQARFAPDERVWLGELGRMAGREAVAAALGAAGFPPEALDAAAGAFVPTLS